MFKLLLIEIKDTKVLVNFVGLTTYGLSVLLSKDYEYEADSAKEIDNFDLTSFDISWIPKMKKDINELFEFEMINEIYLIVNTSGTLIKTEQLNIRANNRVKNVYIEKIEMVASQYPKLKMLTHNLEYLDETTFKKTLGVSYEFVNKQLLNNIIQYLQISNVRIKEVISTKDAICQALKNCESLNIFNIQIEDKFTAFHYLKNNKFLKTIKKNQGLNFIYRNISEYAGITIQAAKILFMKYGNIPPEAIKDNRIIYNDLNAKGERKIFSKKDLSMIITKSVNKILGEIVENIKENKLEGYEIVFSGAITKLKGFEDYSKNVLNIEKISNFKTNLIGIISKSEIISIGGLYYLETLILKRSLDLKNNLNFNKSINKKGIIQLLSDKASRYYDYI